MVKTIFNHHFIELCQNSLSVLLEASMIDVTDTTYIKSTGNIANHIYNM